MKVLFCSPYLDSPDVVRGGINQWGRNYMSYYKEYGNKDIELIPVSFDRHLYLSNGDVPLWKRIWSGIKEQGVAVLRAKSLMKQHKPDMVHICTSAGMGLIKDMLLIRAAKKYGSKTALHLHFGRTPDLLSGNNWEAKLFQCVLNNCDVPIAMNQPTMRALKDYGYTTAEYLPNPLPLDIIHQVKKFEGTIKRKSNTVLYVGHVTRTKGVYELVEACSQLDGISLRIVGKCPPADRIALLDISSKKDGNSWIEFVGEVSHEQVLKELFEADIFGFPSYSEGFPNVILEAMACGCAIASSSVGAIPEMLDIEGAPCGICYPPKSVDAVKESIEQLLNNPQQKKQYVEKAGKRVFDMYAMPKVWKQMVKIWEQSCSD